MAIRSGARPVFYSIGVILWFIGVLTSIVLIGIPIMMLGQRFIQYGEGRSRL